MTVGEVHQVEKHSWIQLFICGLVSRIQVIDEILYILMNGTGVGFSVERQFVSELPMVDRRVSSK